VAFNQRWALGYIEKFMKRSMNPINMVGGGAVSDIWC
jgi:xylulokinase